MFSFLVCDDTAWVTALAGILRPRAVVPDRRLLYKYTEPPRPWHGSIPVDYDILPVDRDLLESSAAIPERIARWFEHNFGSQAGFLDRGFGAAAIQANRIVAWCLSDSVVGDRSDVGVETEEPHRRKGLAYCTTSKALEQAFARV